MVRTTEIMIELFIALLVIGSLMPMFAQAITTLNDDGYGGFNNALAEKTALQTRGDFTQTKPLMSREDLLLLLVIAEKTEPPHLPIVLPSGAQIVFNDTFFTARGTSLRQMHGETDPTKKYTLELVFDHTGPTGWKVTEVTP